MEAAHLAMMTMTMTMAMTVNGGGAAKRMNSTQDATTFSLTMYIGVKSAAEAGSASGAPYLLSFIREVWSCIARTVVPLEW